MKRTKITVMVLALIFLMVGISAAAQESGQEATPSEKKGGEASQKAKKSIGPIDSSLVIPKGPQWIGAPIMPDGNKVKEESGRLVLEYGLPYDKVFAWYKEALLQYPDARYRNWEEEMYIEDQGVSKWHAIRISKKDGPKTFVTIQKDSWTWVLATLFIRFTGVFVVLLILWVTLNIAIYIMRKTMKESPVKPSASHA
ncbi:MAG: hypothetical protein N3G78_10735 [Desulfobacterota bacterium]|nr:hypothetical protein [Thermodesulfobacteriota bacterium]